MTLLRESYLYDLWTVLCALYDASALHRLLAKLGAWCTAQIEGSAVLRPLCREGALSQAGLKEQGLAPAAGHRSGTAGI